MARRNDNWAEDRFVREFKDGFGRRFLSVLAWLIGFLFLLTLIVLPTILAIEFHFLWVGAYLLIGPFVGTVIYQSDKAYMRTGRRPGRW